MATQSRSNIPNTRSFQPLSGMISSQFELPEGLAQSIQQPYITNGLTYKSNNKFVMQRDDAGNIVLDATADKIQNLIIEPNIERITNKSVVEVFNTQFNYFKFPAKTKNTGAFGAFDIGDIDLGIEDNLNSRYTVPISINEYGVPETSKRISIGNMINDASGLVTPGNSVPAKWFDSNVTDDWQYDWYTYGDENVNRARGWQRVPFSNVVEGVAQQEPGTFTMTPDIINQLRENNKTLRFEIELNFYLTTQGDPDVSNGSNNNFGIYLGRTMPTQFRTNSAISPSGQMVYDRKIPPYNIDNLGTTYSQGYKFISINYIIDITNARDYDKYFVMAAAQYKAYYLPEYAFWNITVIDNPGPGNYGVQ